MMDVKQYLTAWAARYKDDLTTDILPFWLEHGLSTAVCTLVWTAMAY